MPSGSHGGSRGSHSSGGSSFGGGSSGGRRGGSSHGIHLGMGRHYIFIGGSRYAIPTKLSWVSTLSGILLVIGFFALIIGIISLPEANQSISKIKEDYRYYQNMISYAESHYEYEVMGTITDYFYNADCERYYITYSFTKNGYTVEGYSFSVYTRDEVFRIHIGDNIRLAVNSNPVTPNTDSIPMDYKDMPLSKDGEYLKALEARNFGLTLSIVGGASLGAVVVMFVVLFKVAQKNAEKQKQAVNNENKIEKEKTVCQYCGLTLIEGQTECSGCGAKTRIQKSITKKNNS